MSTEGWNLVVSWIDTLATLGGVGIGCYPLTEWKRIRHAELAERIIEHATTLIGIIHWARFPGRADGETLFGSHGDVQKDATVVAERLRNREDDLKQTFGLARRAERHLDADGKAVYEDMMALYRVAQNVDNAALALTLRGRKSRFRSTYPDRLEREGKRCARRRSGLFGQVDRDASQAVAMTGISIAVRVTPAVRSSRGAEGADCPIRCP